MSRPPRHDLSPEVPARWFPLAGFCFWKAWCVPFFGLALIIALFFGWQMKTSKTDQAANPTSQTSSTGASFGETGSSTVQDNPDMKANRSAGAAPTKAPNTNPSAAETQPQPQPNP